MKLGRSRNTGACIEATRAVTVKDSGLRNVHHVALDSDLMSFKSEPVSNSSLEYHPVLEKIFKTYYLILI